MSEEQIRKMDEYLRKYIRAVDCVRQGRMVKLTITYYFDSADQAREYVSRVKMAKTQLGQ